MKEEIKLCISPCPNDTFIFYGILSGKIPLSFDLSTEFLDIEELNQRVREHNSGFYKLSFACYFREAKNYQLLESGAALGYGCGPLLLASPEYQGEDLQEFKVLVPGMHTTATALFSYFYPGCKNLEAVLFSQIEKRLAQEKNTIGVIIHESRFTYEKLGLQKLADLGDLYEKKTGLPIPLGGIAASNDLPGAMAREFDQAIRKSLAYSWKHPEEALKFCAQYAQEMEVGVMRSHIDLYVNEFSMDLGPKGKQALNFFQNLL